MTSIHRAGRNFEFSRVNELWISRCRKDNRTWRLRNDAVSPWAARDKWQLQMRKESGEEGRKGGREHKERVIKIQDRKESPNNITWFSHSFLDKTRLTENTQDFTDPRYHGMWQCLCLFFQNIYFSFPKSTRVLRLRLGIFFIFQNRETLSIFKGKIPSSKSLAYLYWSHSGYLKKWYVSWRCTLKMLLCLLRSQVSTVPSVRGKSQAQSLPERKGNEMKMPTSPAGMPNPLERFLTLARYNVMLGYGR